MAYRDRKSGRSGHASSEDVRERTILLERQAKLGDFQDLRWERRSLTSVFIERDW